MLRITALVLASLAVGFFPGEVMLRAEQMRQIRFDRHIQPILLDHCYACHGPDEAARQADLRLDRPNEWFQARSTGARLITPGNRQQSLLYQKLTAQNSDERMPPADFKHPLNSEQIERIGQWIDAGAAWSGHWAFQPVRRPELPSVQKVEWPREAIDYFTLAAMEQAGLEPSPEADPRTLVRRVTLDLTGLPPTPEELQDYLNDPAPDRYERLIERLLASPRFGERMASHWLDLARYADTHGYHLDAHRDMWRWRDWVIGAYNSNMPFDQFTIEQLAGDLLPNATLEQQIASGFNRNHMINFEDGAIPEEFRIEYVADRATTTATVWMGLTFECARCHDHKYDPVSQREYYQWFAFFNNIDEQGIDGGKGNAEPLLPAPTQSQREELRRLTKQLDDLEIRLAARAASAEEDQQRWEQQVLSDESRLPAPPQDMLVHCPLDESQGGEVRDRAREVAGRIHGTSLWLPGRYGNALLCDGRTWIDLPAPGALEANQPFSLSFWIYPTTRDAMGVIRNRSERSEEAIEVALDDGYVHLRLFRGTSSPTVRVRTDVPLAMSQWQHVLVTSDGTGELAGIAIYLDGQTQPVVREPGEQQVEQDDSPGLWLARAGEASALRGMLDELRVYRRILSADEIGRLVHADPVREILQVAANERTPQQQSTLQQFYLENVDSLYRDLRQQQVQLERDKRRLETSIPTTMVMRELSVPRATHVLDRGDYRYPLEEVFPDVPGCLPPLPGEHLPNSSPDRLRLARWLTDPAHPLTARVAVNRYWQLLFGAGLVRTPEDFGVRGEPPTHPELLDWLASEFVSQGWDRKQLLRAIVLSATYRQSSRINERLQERDPENRLLARGPRERLSAEMIRDSALFVSGLLHERVGGKSVSPYQPPGLWEEISYNPLEFTAQAYVQGEDADLYRRSLYTFWKRALPLPTLALFDAPTRETCTVRRSRTNTPLQALVLMNDPTYVEAARNLAERILAVPALSPAERIELAYERVLCRMPSEFERNELHALYEQQLAEFQQNREAARQLIAVGESERDEALDPAELAAWTTVASVLLSLDETITKQ